MPKVAIDFTKTVIYHFVCKDEMIKCSYVGSTTNFNKRKGQHKAACHCETSKDYHYKVYQTIREYGGWTNWDMKPLEEYPCENKTQQVIREQYWINQLKPDMNSKVAYREGETVSEKQKAYYEENKEEILIKAKDYAEANKDHIKERKKAYRERTIEHIKEKKSIKYTCECGHTLCFVHKVRHERSKKHLEKIFIL